MNNTNQKNNAQAKQGDKKNPSQDYTLAYLDYGNLIGCVSKTKPFVNVINIQGPNNKCVVTTWKTRFNIVGPLVPSPSQAQYNIIEHLRNMSAQISILELLCTSHAYREIFDSALHESHVPIDFNTTEFQNLVGCLSTPCALSFKTTNIPKVEPNHTLPLYIAIMVSNFCIMALKSPSMLTLNPFPIAM